MREELVALCRAKFGARWQSALARAVCEVVPGSELKPVLRTIQRYAAGDSAPTPIGEAAIRLLTGNER